MQRNLKKHEFLIADKQLATLLVQRAQFEKDSAHLLPAFTAYLADIDDQLANYTGN